MSLAGVINSHTMAALIVLNHGTDEQRLRLLPRFASGQARGGLCLTEPHAGSDVQAIRTVARREGDRYLLSGSKMFVTNGREGNTFALLALTDPAESPRHRGMSCFIVEKGAPGPRGGEVDRQARLQGRGHRGAGLRRLPLPGGEPGGRRGGPRLQARHVRARGRADQHRGARGGGRPGRPRRGGARGPRAAGAARRARGHRHARGVGPARHLLGRRHEGPRRPVRSRGGHGQAPRVRGGPGGRGGGHEDRGRARPARLRPGGAALPRRSAHDHRRGHQRDPAAHHLPEPARAVRGADGRADLARRAPGGAEAARARGAPGRREGRRPVGRRAGPGPPRYPTPWSRSSPSSASSARWPTSSTAASACRSRPPP